MKIDILTLFPEMFLPVINESILGRAKENKILDIELHNIRDYTKEKYNKVDEVPFGGNGGMLMMADPIFNTLESVGAKGRKIIYMSPRGSIIDSKKITELSKLDEMVILCGHYEGIDQRIIEDWSIEELSIGDYILTGGELPAMVLIDSVARLLPGVLGNEKSALDESIYSGLLEHDQYTRPREYRGMEVPEVLLNGHHQKIEDWKFENSLINTKNKRKDLFDKFIKADNSLTKNQKKIVEKILKIKDV